MLDLVEPLPIGDDRPTDNHATHREHHRRAAILSLYQTVDLADQDFQRPVDLRVPMVGHPAILLCPSTGSRCSIELAALCPHRPTPKTRSPTGRSPDRRVTRGST